MRSMTMMMMMMMMMRAKIRVMHCYADDSFLLSNARLFDHPVVYCSSGFTQLTGWSRHDLLRRSSACVTMHGPLTDPDDVARLRHALQSDAATEPFQIVLYTTNGEFFLSVNDD